MSDNHDKLLVLYNSRHVEIELNPEWTRQDLIAALNEEGNYSYVELSEGGEVIDHRAGVAIGRCVDAENKNDYDEPRGRNILQYLALPDAHAAGSLVSNNAGRFILAHSRMVYIKLAFGVTSAELIEALNKRHAAVLKDGTLVNGYTHASLGCRVHACNRGNFRLGNSQARLTDLDQHEFGYHNL